MDARTPKSPSKYEWIFFFLFALLAALHLFIAAPGSSISKFSLFVGIGLIPGILVRLAGKPSRNVHRICFAFSLIAFVLDNPKLRPDAETVQRIAANWPLVALGFLASFTQPVWGALRSHRLLRDSGVVISKWQAFELVLIGTFFNIFLPGSTGGDAYRVYVVIKKFNARLGAAIASITLDRFLGLPALIFVVVMGMILEYDFFRSNRVLSGLVPFIAGAAIVCFFLVVYLAFAGKSRRKEPSASTASSYPAQESTGWLGRMHRMVADNVKSSATLPLALLFGFLAHLACIGSCLCFGLALGVEGVPPLRYFLIVPMAMAINAIPGAPGGVGQGELAMATLLDMAYPGVGNAQVGVMVMLLFRLTNMAMGLSGGFLYATGKSGKSSRTQMAEMTEIAEMGEALAAANSSAGSLKENKGGESGNGY